MQAPGLWRNRDYLLLWSGQVASTLGSSAIAVVYPLLIIALTQSPEAAGIASSLRTLPYVVLSLPVGALIDRAERRRVMVLCDVGRALAVGSVPLAMALGRLTLPQIWLVTLVEGSLFVFFNIAEVAALPRVVARADLPQATAQNEAALGVAGILGASLGTLVYQNLGHGAPFVANVVGYLLSAACLVRIRTSFQEQRVAAQRPLVAEIAEGLAWLWREPLIRFMALLTGGMNLVSFAEPLVFIVLAKQTGASDAQIGIVFAAGGVGAIVGSLIGGRLRRRFSFGTIIIATIWAHALLIGALFFLHRFALLAVVNALMALLVPIYNVVQFSHRVALIPDRLQGRVNSTFRLLAFGLTPVGGALAGFIIERRGVTSALAFLAAVYLLLAVATSANRHVRHAAAPGGAPGAPENASGQESPSSPA